MDTYYSDELVPRTLSILREYERNAYARPKALYMNPLTWNYYRRWSAENMMYEVSRDAIFGIPVHVDYSVPEAELEFAWDAKDARAFSDTVIESVRTRDGRLLIDAV